MKNLFPPFLLILLLFPGFGAAQQDPIDIFKGDLPEEHARELQFFAFFLNQGVSSNFYPENSLLKGQVFGRLFGQNSTNTSDSLTANYIEQRIIPFFIYQPKLFNGKALLRTSFEIDWTWGDVAYGTGGNFGAGISADQVNLQTQNVELEFIPAPRWQVNLGLMRMFDTPYNPYRTLFDKMLTTGYRLSYWGTDAVGVTARYDGDFHKFKIGAYKLYESLPQSADDVSMISGFYEKSVAKAWQFGLSGNYVRDRGNGDGGVSILGQGLNATQLNAYNGTFKFNFGSTPYRADLFWLGTFFHRNAETMLDRFFLTGFANFNFGKAELQTSPGRWETGADIAGLGGNLRMGYRHGQTTDDIVSIDLIYASGDDDALLDKKYTGVMTGNMWGAPANIFIGTGAHLLFPHGNVVNRFTPVVADLSNMGYGLLGGTVNLSKDLIPHRLNAKVGGAWAMSQVEPLGGGKTLGTELNAAIRYNFGPFMSLKLHGANLWLGDFFDSNDTRFSGDVNGAGNTTLPVDPWTVFLVFQWLMF